MGVYKYGRTIPEFVKRYREEMAMSQNDLAIKLGVIGQYVSEVERGRMSNAFCKKFYKILKGPRKDAFAELYGYEVADEAVRKLVSR